MKLVSLIKISLDTSLRSPFEILRHEFHLGNLGIVRNLLVDFRKSLMQFRLKFSLAESVKLCLMIVRLDKGNKRTMIFNYQ